MIVRIEDKLKELQAISDKGRYFDLYDTGLSGLDEVYKAVKGYPVYIGGYPFSGKSEFATELAISLSIRHGFKWCVYLGEAGKTEIAIAEIASKIIGKSYFYMSESDKVYAHQFISERFFFVELPSFTIKEFYDEVSKAEKDLGIKFTGTILDPFNDIVNESVKHGGTHIWMEEDLKYIRKQSQDNDRIDIVVMHIQDIKPIQDKDSGVWYMRPAMPSEWANGQVIQRRAYTMLLVYRVPEDLKDENGVPFGENKTWIINQKPKPKGTGKKGKALICWDWKANRYYEESGGTRKYMLDKSSKQIEPKMRKLEDIIGDDKEPF